MGEVDTTRQKAYLHQATGYDEDATCNHGRIVCKGLVGWVLGSSLKQQCTKNDLPHDGSEAHRYELLG